MLDKIIFSSSLIRKPPPLAELDEEYRAELKEEWMGEWYPEEFDAAASNSTPQVDNENKVPCKQRNPLSLSLSKTKKKALHVVTASADESHRFTPPYSTQELQQLAEGLKPAKTEASTRWAIKTFTKWAHNRKTAVPNDPIPDNLLECHDPATVSKYLCMFVAETRKENGEKYLPATIRSLFSGINRTLQENKAPFSILTGKMFIFVSWAIRLM